MHRFGNDGTHLELEVFIVPDELLENQQTVIAMFLLNFAAVPSLHQRNGGTPCVATLPCQTLVTNSTEVRFSSFQFEWTTARPCRKVHSSAQFSNAPAYDLRRVSSPSAAR